MNYLFQICNIVFEVRNIEREQSISRLLPFSIKGKKADYVYDVIYKESICMDEEESIIYSDNNFLTITERAIYHHFMDSAPYARLQTIDSNTYELSLLSDCRDQDVHEYFIPDLLHLEMVLLKHKGFPFHSSCIEYNGKTILFSAPSGGGKSTQADLWKNACNARILNGDKNFIIFENGQWMAYSSPMSGSSEYCTTEGFPLAAIVLLEKGECNELNDLGIMGFQGILRNTMLDYWDENAVVKVFDLIEQLCNAIPVYHYTCTKETSAAFYLRDKLFGE